MNEHQLARKLGIQTPSPMQIITPDWHGIDAVQVMVKRDDLIHPLISGNKWRKLKQALLAAVQANTQHIVSFGGGFSNHIHALGYCCQQLNIEFSAIIRGDYSNNPSPMLKDLAQWQANIHYVNRLTYQQRDQPAYLKELSNRYPNAVIIPEGGSQLSALSGTGEIVAEMTQAVDYIVAPVGSGGTLAGLIANMPSNRTQILGVAVLKGVGYLESLVQQLLPNNINSNNWRIEHGFHCGGYGKRSNELISFCQQFTQQTGISVEPVYSGKMFLALKTLIESNKIAAGSVIMPIHTGGLQGKRESVVDPTQTFTVNS